MNRLYKSFSIIAMLLAITACVPEQVSKFEFSKKIWSTMGPSHYEFTVHENCGQSKCDKRMRPVYTVEIKDGVVVKTVNNDNAIANHTQFKWALMFDDIFDAVAAQVFDHPNKNVEYDLKYGFINSALDFTISNFKNLSAPEATTNTPLEKAEQLWSEKKPNSYSFTVSEKICNNVPMCELFANILVYTIHVKDNMVQKVVSQTFTSQGEILPKDQYELSPWINTMDALFILANRGENATNGGSGAFVDVEESYAFDTELGYITESAYYTISEFTVKK
ncbi:MAG: DUF6174 domain-containing protein [Pseudomonadota bacterium]